MNPSTLLRVGIALGLGSVAMSAQAWLISTAGDSTAVGVITTTDYKYSNLAGMTAPAFTYTASFNSGTGAFTGNFVNGGNILQVSNPTGNVSSANNTVSFSGTWTKGATTTMNVASTGTYSATFDMNSQRYNLSLTGTAVPEPASFAVLGLGVVALLRRRRRA